MDGFLAKCALGAGVVRQPPCAGDLVPQGRVLALVGSDRLCLGRHLAGVCGLLVALQSAHQVGGREVAHRGAARRAGDAVVRRVETGHGGQRDEAAPTLAEVKRMYTRPEVQGQGIGGAILAEIEALARREGLSRLVLETGDRHPAAWRVYERGGFTRCGAVLDYGASPFSVFYEKVLVPA